MLRDAEILKALRDIKTGKKTAITLTDPAPRGAGRLVLIVKPGRADWYAARYPGGKRRLQRLGRYPDMALVDARTRFGEVRGIAAPGRATLGRMFDGYLASMDLRGAVSAPEARRLLGHAADAIGGSRLARDITAADIAAMLRPVYARGSPAQAAKYRDWLRSAFQWALQAGNDYRMAVAPQWGVTVNPVDSVPVDRNASKPGQRWLTPAELIRLLAWCRSGESKSQALIELLALTGQRSSEIRCLRGDQWDGDTLAWDSTKNGRGHCIPVPARAAEILNSRPAGLMFPNKLDRHRPMGEDTAREMLQMWAAREKLKPIKVHDLRRTWKTLAGHAGLTKAERDLLQNHHGQDVATKHYDRYDAMPEKRAAIQKWEAYLEKIARENGTKAEAHDV